MKLTRRPAGLTIAEPDVLRVVARNLLNMGLRLSHVVEVGVGGIVDLLALPVREAVGQAETVSQISIGVQR